MELKSWDSETLKNYPSLAGVCYLIGAGGYPLWDAGGLSVKLSDSVSITMLLERYISKYGVRCKNSGKKWIQ